jgi:hypothetical protein
MNSATWCLVIPVAAVLWSCSPAPSVEQQVIGRIQDMEAQIEAGERGAFMEHVAPDFIGQDPIMTHDQLSAMIMVELMRHQRVHAQVFPIQVTPTMPGQAEANFKVLLTGGPGLLPDRGQMFSITSRWIERDDEWLLQSARWQAVSMNSAVE